MNIEKIVLGVLDKIEVKNMWSKSYKEDIAKSISDKIQVVSIGRDEVIRILIDIVVDHKQIYGVLDSKVQDYADKILSLLKPAKTLNREEVDTIITKLLKRLYEIEHGACEQITGKPMNDYVLNRQNAINKAINGICNLGIPKPILQVNKEELKTLLISNCWVCNKMKNTLTKLVFVKQIERICENFKKKIQKKDM